MGFPNIPYDILWLIGNEVIRHRSASIIQAQFREFLYEKKMIEEGNYKLPCGIWSNGAQCMCLICLGYE